MPRKYTESYQKITFFCLKGDFEPQYFTLRTIGKPCHFERPKLFKISLNLRLGVLINFVLIKKRVYTNEERIIEGG